MKEDPETVPQSPMKGGSAPPARPTSLLERPIDLGPLDKPVDLGAWREFFSLTGGSILYCISAMCVIYGVSAVLGSVFARSYVLGETLPCIVALNVYEIALLTVLVVIVVWQNVTDDAISLVVLAAIFLVVTGIALTTTAGSRPPMVLLIGGCCFAVAMAKVFVLRRFVGMNISPILWAGLAVVLGWNFLVGARLAEAATTKDVTRDQWLVSFLVLLAGAVLVLLDTALRRREPPDASGIHVPFLRRPAMGWILALIVLVAAGVHQRALAYVFRVNFYVVDFLPIVCILSLIFLHLALHLRWRSDAVKAALAELPLVGFIFSLVDGPVLTGPVLGMQLPWYAPVYFGLTGLAVLWTGIRWRCRPLLVVAAFYGLAVVLTFKFNDARAADLHWYLSGALLVAGLLAAGLVRRSEGLCVAAVVIGTIGFALTDAFGGFAKCLNLSEWGALLGLAGFGTLAVAILFGRMHPALLVPAALGVMFSVFDFLPSEFGWKDVFAVLAVLAPGVGLWLRVRHRPSLVILCVPFGWRLAAGSILLAGWRFVLLGFVLLFVGAILSIRKGKRARRQASGPAEAGAAAPGAAPSGAAEDPSSSRPGT
jgi:hypothetical protein